MNAPAPTGTPNPATSAEKFLRGVFDDYAREHATAAPSSVRDVDHSGDDDAFEVPAVAANSGDLLARLTRWLRDALAQSHSEVEARVRVVGCADAASARGADDDAVPRRAFYRLLERCTMPGTRWDASDKSHTEVYAFDDDVRATRHADGSAEFMRKTLVSSLDLQLRANGGANGDDDGHAAARCVDAADRALCIRVSHKRELPIDTPAAMRPRLVRVRQRHSFTHGDWRYDLTFVKQGVTQQAALAAPLHYEIELEYVPRASATDSRDARYVAASLLAKAQQLVVALADDATDAARAHRAALAGDTARFALIGSRAM